MKKIILFFLIAFLEYATAQSTAVLNQRLGTCNAQIDRMKRAQCFESLAKDALTQLNIQPVTSNIIVSPTPSPLKIEPNSSIVSKYYEVIKKSKEAAVYEFKDPSSVQWKNLFISEKYFTALCGELNAKNSYGGYIGFRRFFSVPSQEITMNDRQDNESISSLFANQWNIYCSHEVEKINQH